MLMQLLDGTNVDSSELTLNPATYHVYWDSGAAGLLDVTNTMTRAQKQQLPGFDVSIDNLRLSNEAHGGSNRPLPTNTLGILGSQLYNDPFGAPIDQAGRILGGAGSAITGNLLKNTGLQALLLYGAIGLGI